MSSIFTPENTQALLQVIGSVVGILLSWVLVAIRQRTGVLIRVDQEIEIDKLRERLTQAIYNGVWTVIDNYPELDSASQEDRVMNYLRKGIPDTLDKLNVSNDILRQRIRAQIGLRSAPDGFDVAPAPPPQESGMSPDGQTAASG